MLVDDRAVGFPHRAQSFGGPGSFQTRLIQELNDRGFRAVYPDDPMLPFVILVIGGTVRIDWLIRCRRKGVRVIQRLDGINWRHKVIDCSSWYKVRSEIRNTLTRIVRQKLAHEVVYQSKFVQEWWKTIYGEDKVTSHIVHNAVNLREFYPTQNRSGKAPLIICAESVLKNDQISIKLLRHLARALIPRGEIRGIRIIGTLGAEEKKRLSEFPGIEVYGAVPRSRMPYLLREGEIFLNLDINAACPNAVIEALASGLPVVGFRTGALEELVPLDAGNLVSYGGNPWKLEKPDLAGLSDAIVKVASNLNQFSLGARRVAETRFDINQMADTYIKVLSQ